MALPLSSTLFPGAALPLSLLRGCLLESSMILLRLLSLTPVTIIPTRLSQSFCWFVRSFCALIEFSQVTCGAACARKTFDSHSSTLSCVTKTLFGALQSWPPQAAHHQLHCFVPCPEETIPSLLQRFLRPICFLRSSSASLNGLFFALPSPEASLAFHSYI